MKYSIFICFLLLGNVSTSQSSYFPPLIGEQWESVSPSSLGWCQSGIDSLDTFLREKGTKAFMVLKNGKIAKETYYGSFTKDSIWYWASAGKSLTSFLVGMAQEKGLLSIQDKTSKYLGQGWTSLSSEQENKITIRHQMTMTTGLEDNVPDDNCMMPSCLKYKADPGTRWAYHNAPYRLIQDVIAKAWGSNYQNFLNTQLSPKTGINGFWYNGVIYSKPRSMARFGLLALNKGIWNGQAILSDQTFLSSAITPSQTLNNAYGLLWWLNGQSSYMIPDLQIVFPGFLISEAPADMYSALGKNDQKIYIIPSQDMVIIRMGEDGGQVTGAISSFDNMLWQKINGLKCTSFSINEKIDSEIDLYPNPFYQTLTIKMPNITGSYSYEIISIGGVVVSKGIASSVPVSEIKVNVPEGLYIFSMQDSFGNVIFTKKIISTYFD